jgi:plasmid maintenance system antidote protein VapI
VTTTDTRIRNLDHKRGRLRRQRGIAGLIDGHTVAAHLKTCIESGWTRLEIATHTGISDRAIRYILAGQPTVQRDNALRLLAVKPRRNHRSGTVGIIRRTRALARAGYPIAWTATQTGCSNRYIYEILNGAVNEISRDLADRFADLYRRHEATPGPSEKARIAAAAKGWPGPEAWDVDTIDDPDTEPDLGDRVLNFQERAALRREEIIHLAWCGHEPEQILDRLNGEVSISTVRAIVHEWRTGQKRQRKQVAA